MYLKNRANKDKTCFPAIGTIAADLKLSKRTVERALGGFGEGGFCAAGIKMEAARRAEQ